MPGLLPPAERKARIAEKRQAILRFLREEIYTTREVVQELLNVAPTPAKVTLAHMCRDGLLRMEKVECPNGWKPFLYGITAEGQALAFDPATEQPNDKIFEPGRVGLTVLRHTISLQRMHMKAERAGWVEWVAGDRLGVWEKDQGRPDAIAKDPTGVRWAIEVEHTTKTTKRYEAVLWDRLRQIKAGNFDMVIWILDDDDRAKRLEIIIKSIKEFTREHAGQRQTVRIDAATHHPKFAFTTFEKFTKE